MNYAIEVLKCEELRLESFNKIDKISKKYLAEIREAIADLEEREVQRQMRREGSDIHRVEDDFGRCEEES